MDNNEIGRINQIKKQAKRLSRLLPEYLATHAEPAKLSACQELVAMLHGYANFHAAMTNPIPAKPDEIVPQDLI